MSKKIPSIKVIASELTAGYVIKLPEKLRADEVRIVSIEDGSKTMNVQPCTIHVAKVVGAYGPFASLEATILLDSNGEVIVTKEPERKGFFSNINPFVLPLCLVLGLASFLSTLHVIG